MFDENELERLTNEVERAHLFLDECHIGGDGTETLAERLCRKERDTFILFVAAGEVRLAEAPVVWKWDAVVRETAS